jgi:oxaloacetate decarboxylase beta subunit
MKSVKFYFSLLLSAVMLSVAMPAMAQDEAAAEAQAEIEAIAETAEAEAIAVVDEGAEAAVAAAVQGTQGRDNSSIDEEFSVGNAISNFVDQAGFNGFLKGDNWKCAVMLLISFLLLYLAIVKQFEPLLLMPIAFGMLLTNLPGAGMFHSEFFAGGHVHWGDFALGSAGLLDYLYLGVKLGIYPCLIFVGVGAMTDFAPLIANPKSLLLGAAAQIGIFATFLGALALGFNYWEAGSIGIIGGADGPTAIYLTSKLAPHLLGPIAVAAYSYMALVPVIQPPIMKLLTTEKERKIEMKQLRSVSQREKIVFPIVITVIIALLLPSAAPLIGCLMLGNLMKECGVTERLSKTVQNELMNIVTIFLGISVGATATAEAFLNWQTLGILTLGIVAFSFGSASGVILAKIMNLFSKEKINPLIGSAGVSAVPMAARVSQSVGQKYNPGNFLLMHAMGPNVAGVIGSAVAAGILLAFLPI